MKLKFLNVVFAGIVLSVSCLVNLANAGLIAGGDVRVGSSFLHSDYGQSFLSIDRYINSISVYVGDWNNHQNSPFELRVTLFDRADWAGNSIFDELFELPMNYAGWNGLWYTFDLGSVSVIKGNSYAFKVSSTYGNGGIYYSSTNSYNYGSMIETWDGTDASNFVKPPEGFSSNGELAFTVEGSDTAQDVSEPSTLVIFALGIIGLVSRRFKKQ